MCYQLNWGIGSVSVSVDVDEVDESGAYTELAHVLEVVLDGTGLGNRQHSHGYKSCETCESLTPHIISKFPGGRGDVAFLPFLILEEEVMLRFYQHWKFVANVKF
jgi:hypothetical protein